MAAAAAGEYQQAESARIEAYAIFETGPEKRLLAFTPDAALKVERLFWEGDGTTPGPLPPDRRTRRAWRVFGNRAKRSTVNWKRRRPR